MSGIKNYNLLSYQYIKLDLKNNKFFRSNDTGNENINTEKDLKVANEPDISNILKMSQEGTLTQKCVENWLKTHENEIDNLSFCEKKEIIQYHFKYQGNEFDISAKVENSFQENFETNGHSFIIRNVNIVYNDNGTVNWNLSTLIWSNPWNSSRTYDSINNKSTTVTFNEFLKRTFDGRTFEGGYVGRIK